MSYYPGDPNNRPGVQHQTFQPGYGQPPQQQPLYMDQQPVYGSNDQQQVYQGIPQQGYHQNNQHFHPHPNGQPITYVVVEQRRPQRYYDNRDGEAEACGLAALCVICCCCCMPGPNDF